MPTTWTCPRTWACPPPIDRSASNHCGRARSSGPGQPTGRSSIPRGHCHCCRRRLHLALYAGDSAHNAPRDHRPPTAAHRADRRCRRAGARRPHRHHGGADPLRRRHADPATGIITLALTSTPTRRRWSPTPTRSRAFRIPSGRHSTSASRSPQGAVATAMSPHNEIPITVTTGLCAWSSGQRQQVAVTPAAKAPAAGPRPRRIVAPGPPGPAGPPGDAGAPGPSGSAARRSRPTRAAGTRRPTRRTRTNRPCRATPAPRARPALDQRAARHRRHRRR